jgi:hypothetical protein
MVRRFVPKFLRDRSGFRRRYFIRSIPKAITIRTATGSATCLVSLRSLIISIRPVATRFGSIRFLNRLLATRAMTSLIFIGSRRATGRTTASSISAPIPSATCARRGIPRRILGHGPDFVRRFHHGIVGAGDCLVASATSRMDGLCRRGIELLGQLVGIRSSFSLVSCLSRMTRLETIRTILE